MKKIFVIEGLPSSGKTTFMNNCRENVKDKFSYIDEIANELKQGETFPGNSTHSGKVKEINSWFIAKESERFQRASEYSISKLTLMDRAYFSHLPYSFAYSKMTGRNILDLTFAYYINAAKMGLIGIPMTILYFKIKPETSLNRTLRRKYPFSRARLPDFWLKKEFLSDVKMGYNLIFKDFKEICKVKIINSENAIPEVYKETIDFLDITKNNKNPYKDLNIQALAQKLLQIKKKLKLKLR